MTCCIYKLTSPSGKCYIGQSVNFERRLVEHRNKKRCKNMPKLYNAFAKYGFESFSIEILKMCNPEQLNDLEIYYISHYDSFNNGYNSTSGGNSNFKVSQDTKNKLSKIFTNTYNGNQNIPFMIDKTEYSSIGEASKSLNIPPKTIHNRLNSSNIKFQNYLYVDISLRPARSIRKYKVKPCIINEIKYNSIKNAAISLNINYHSLYKKLSKGNFNIKL